MCLWQDGSALGEVSNLRPRGAGGQTVMTFTEHDLGPEIPVLRKIERVVLMIGKEASHDG